MAQPRSRGGCTLVRLLHAGALCCLCCLLHYTTCNTAALALPTPWPQVQQKNAENAVMVYSKTYCPCESCGWGWQWTASFTPRRLAAGVSGGEWLNG